MKKTLLFGFLAACIGFMPVQAQEVIIEEDFQDWEATDDTDPLDCESGLVFPPELTRTITVTTDDGTDEMDVYMIKCGIAPECNTKRVERGDQPENTDGVTTGYVQLNKVAEEGDTLGEMIFGPIPQVDSVEIAHSATGGDRSIRLFTSTDKETWTQVSDDIYLGSGDVQAGVVNVVEVDATDVYLRFTSGIDIVDDMSQHSRLHNIKVWGTPGHISNVHKPDAADLLIYTTPGGILKIDGRATSVTIYNAVGSPVKFTDRINGNTVDISALQQGVYIVKVADIDGQIHTQKIVKQ